MASNQSLEELIRSKEIEFHSAGRKLDTNLSDFGAYNQDLTKHLVSNSGNNITLRGKGLESYLTTVPNLYSLADFVVQVAYRGGYRNIVIHVDVDINHFDIYYQLPPEEKIVNFIGKVVDNPALFVPEMPYFEKQWNFALCRAHLESGYEYPGDENSFRYRIAGHAEKYMIGTPEQINRYKQYVLDAINTAIAITEELKKNPEIAFEKYTGTLMKLENVTNRAKRIAENINHFSGNY